MSRVLELKGTDIIDAYNGLKLSEDFGYSCANFNVSYFNEKESDAFFVSRDMNGNDMEMFEVFTENTENISCFVYINEQGKIEGRRMFFKGKQLLDHNIFPINTKMGEDVYYLYGYYGNKYSMEFNRQIVRNVLNTYKGLVTLDRGFIIDGHFVEEKEYWIMQIEKMDYDKYPPIDFLNLSTELKSFSNFNPSRKIVRWLEDKYEIDDVEFHTAYRYSPSEGDGGYFQHWNQKFFKDEEETETEPEDYDDEESQEVQDDDVQENKIVKKFNKYDKKI